MNPEDKTCSELKGTLSVLGDKWSAIILWSLSQKPQRFIDLQKNTQGINPRTLTQRLHMLESEGLVTRHEFKEYPPRTEYRITEKGEALQPVIKALCAWADKYLNDNACTPCVNEQG